MEATIAGLNVNVNDEGYLTDFSQWNEDVAKEIAVNEGIGELTEGRKGQDHQQQGDEQKSTG